MGEGLSTSPPQMARMSPGTCPDPTSVGGVGGGRPWEEGGQDFFRPGRPRLGLNPALPLSFLEEEIVTTLTEEERGK